MWPFNSFKRFFKLTFLHNSIVEKVGIIPTLYTKKISLLIFFASKLYFYKLYALKMDMLKISYFDLR